MEKKEWNNNSNNNKKEETKKKKKKGTFLISLKILVNKIQSSLSISLTLMPFRSCLASSLSS